jgi:YesN/AraC family two-component response regulator
MSEILYFIQDYRCIVESVAYETFDFVKTTVTDDVDHFLRIPVERTPSRVGAASS